MGSEAITLYHAAASPNSRRVRIFLAEKALAVNLVPGEQHSEAYRAINPRRVVPRLVLADGTAIVEVPAIWRYLDEAYPNLPLLRTDPIGKALVVMWERRVELEGVAAVMEGVRDAAARLQGRAIAGSHDYEQIPALIDRSRQRVTNFYRDFEARLTDAPFVAGDEFSAADITMLVTVDFATQAFDMPIPPDCGAVPLWHNKAAAR